MVKIAKRQHSPGGYHIAFVDAETEGCGETQAQQGGGQDQPEQGTVRAPPCTRWGQGAQARMSVVQAPSFDGVSRKQPGAASRVPQAAISVVRCSPSPSIPSRIVWPARRNTGGFMPAPTPGGVPVLMMSPACKVMKWLT